MDRPLRIAVADDEPLMQRFYQQTLKELGHEVIAVAGTGEDLLAQCRSYHPDLVITDIRMPDMDGLDAARKICDETPVPIILLSAYHNSELVDRALAEQVLAYLVKPVKKADLETAIAIVMRRFSEFRALHQQADDLRQALEDRKVIERAKGILMKMAGLDENAAFHRLQKLASAKNLKLVEVARLILTAEEAFHPPQ